MLATDQAASHGKGVLRELSPLHRELRRAIPDVYQASANSTMPPSLRAPSPPRPRS
jgi:hypothetical protein